MGKGGTQGRIRPSQCIIIYLTINPSQACRNFIQLCMEGFYDDSIFHRIIKDYLIQGGDPTGTGLGGNETIYGGHFKDEFHQRLKFSHRGLVACANQNIPDSNNSQFFVTLDKTEWLEKKNTIFGRIVGDTIFNLLRMGECATDAEDRPIEPPKIISTEVLWNPFDDIQPRTSRAEREEEKRVKEVAARAKPANVPKKKLELLSFGDEAEEAEEEGPARAKKIVSAHDALNDKRLGKEAPVDERLEKLKRTRPDSDQKGVTMSFDENDEEEEDDQGVADKGFGSEMRERMMAKRRQVEGGGSRAEAAVSRPSDEALKRESARELREERNERIEELKMQTKAKGIGRLAAADAVADAELLKPWQLAREKYKQQKGRIGDREKDTMSRLRDFQHKLNSQDPNKKLPDHVEKATDRAPIEALGYDGKVSTEIDHNSYLPAAWRLESYLDEEDENEDLSLKGLRQHRLKFITITGKTADTGRDVNNLDDLVVFDPLLEKNKGKFSKANQAKEKRQSEWRS